MEQYVYGDVIFAENLIMNYIILWSTAKLAKRRYSKLLFLLSAGLGAIYAVLSFFPQYHYMYVFHIKIVFSLLMVVIAYTPTDLKDFARITGVFYIVSFIFGGAAFGLFYFVNGLKQTVNGISFIDDFPVKSLIAAVIISYIIVRYCWDFIQYRIKRERLITEIHIGLEGKSVDMQALMDTGNALSEPITKTPVLVAEYGMLKELLPMDIQEVFDNNLQEDINRLINIVSKSDWITRFRMIPFKSLGRENGMLVGFKPDEVIIEDNEQKIVVNNVIIGIYNKKLSSDGEYNALVHPDLMNGKKAL